MLTEKECHCTHHWMGSNMQKQQQKCRNIYPLSPHHAQTLELYLNYAHLSNVARRPNSVIGTFNIMWQLNEQFNFAFAVCPLTPAGITTKSAGTVITNILQDSLTELMQAVTWVIWSNNKHIGDVPLIGLDELCSSALLWLFLTTLHCIPILFQLTCLSVAPIGMSWPLLSHYIWKKCLWFCLLTHFNDMLAYS